MSISQLRKTVLILGYGEMGHAMQVLLDQHHDLLIHERFPPAGMKNITLEEAVPQADFVIFCIPVRPHHEVVVAIAPLLKPGCICISIAKGLDEAGLTAAQVFSGVFGTEKSDYALLYGPMISEELRGGYSGFAQLAGSGQNACSSVLELFSGSSLLIELCEDITGISWSVILKNVYALVFGMADELHLGNNMRGFLMAVSLSEIEAIVYTLGGRAGSSYGLAGLGDLVTTATSVDSHHYELGCRLARGEIGNISGEGVHTLEMVDRYSLFDWRQYPLYSMVRRLVARPESVKREISRFSNQFFNQ